jgi:hypothetical protein
VPTVGNKTSDLFHGDCREDGIEVWSVCRRCHCSFQRILKLQFFIWCVIPTGAFARIGGLVCGRRTLERAFGKSVCSLQRELVAWKNNMSR